MTTDRPDRPASLAKNLSVIMQLTTHKPPDPGNPRRKTTLAAAVLLIALVALVAGCDCQGADDTGEPVDGEVRSDTWPDDPQRIVSMAPNTTELLFELGLGDRVVAVTRFCDWPAEAEHLPTIGGMLDPDFEAILDADPDVVVGTTDGADHGVGDRFDRAGIDYGFMAMDDFQSVRRGIERFGAWFDVEHRAAELLGDFDRRLETNSGADGESPRALMVLDTSPVIAAGPGSLGGEMLEHAGVENAIDFAAGDYPMLDAELLLRVNPQILIVTDLGADPDRLPPIFEQLNPERIVHIDDPVVLRPGPRIPEAVELIRNQLESP